MKKWRYVLLVLCTAVISISGTYLMTYFMRSEENKQKYEDISEIGFPATEADHEEENDQQGVKQSEDDFDYQSLVAINSDCVGWIQIPGTDINYPVVQAADNEFYLTHNFNRETAACGAIFMDYRNDVDAKAEHLILYGHQMKDNSMFKQLNGYKEEMFYKEHPNISLYLHKQKYEYEITAVYVTNVANGGSYYNYLHWNTRKEQLNYFQQKMDGYHLLRELRKESNIPVIILSAKDADSEKILGLNLGADDYIAKPFNPLEAVARINSNIRRFYTLGNGEADHQAVSLLKVKDLMLDKDSCVLKKDGKQIELTSVEFRIMELFMEHPGKVFTKQQIYEYGWGEEYIIADNNIMVCISKLRAKLDEDPSAYIKTIRGLGYRLEK